MDGEPHAYSPVSPLPAHHLRLLYVGELDDAASGGPQAVTTLLAIVSRLTDGSEWAKQGTAVDNGRVSDYLLGHSADDPHVTSAFSSRAWVLPVQICTMAKRATGTEALGMLSPPRERRSFSTDCS